MTHYRKKPVIIEAELGFVLDLPRFILALLGSVGVSSGLRFDLAIPE